MVNSLYEIIQAICNENLSGLFAVRIYVGCLPWQFAVVLSIYFFLIRILFLFAFVYQNFLVQGHSFFLTKLFFLWCKYSFLCMSIYYNSRGVYRTLSNIYDGNIWHKQLTTFNRSLFRKKAPSELLDRILNTLLNMTFSWT